MMQMTDAEICRSYKRAIESGTAKTKQIAILSQLNACDKSVIRKILKENGFEVPQNGNRYTAKKSDSSKMSTRLLKSEEQTGLIKSDESENVGTCQQNVGTMSEAPEADGSERKKSDSSNLSTRVPDFVISIAVQKLEDMTKELNELMEYADTLKAQINELRHWISVATEGEENGTEESD